MSGCNIVTISKVETDGNIGDSVEFSKVYNAIITNAKTELYLDYIQENLADKYDMVIDVLKRFAEDTVNVCYSKVKDISIEIDYDEPMNELSIGLKLLLTHGHQLMDDEYFNIAVGLSDKYEDTIIENELHSLSIDFDTVLKGEYTRSITVKKTT